MRGRFIKVRDIVYWIDVDHISYGKPVYKVAQGYYLAQRLSISVLVVLLVV